MSAILIGFRKIGAFLVRDLRTWASYRFAAGLQLAGAFFSLIVWFFISAAVGVREGSAIEEYADNYFDFVVIGLAVSSYVTVSLSGFAGKIRDAQISGTLEALLVTPTSVPTLVVGSTVGDYAGTTTRAIVLLALAAGIFHVPLTWTNLPAAAIVVALTIVAFSGVGLLSAAFVMIFKRGDPIAQAVAWFSMLLGGVYFPARAVGEPALEAFAQFLPLTPALHALRHLLLRGATLAEVAPSITRLAIMAAILLPAGMLAFTAGVRHARRSGSLTHY